jgi:hypothetical protein
VRYARSPAFSDYYKLSGKRMDAARLEIGCGSVVSAHFFGILLSLFHADFLLFSLLDPGTAAAGYRDGRDPRW